MTARVIRESYDGGSIEVGPYDREARPFAHPTADGRIVIEVTERGNGVALLHLTPVEVTDLITALVAALVEVEVLHPKDTRPPAPPMAEGRVTEVVGLRPSPLAEPDHLNPASVVSR